MEALMTALLVWASAHTGLPMPQGGDPLPEVRVIDQCALDELMWPHIVGCSYATNIVAVYSSTAETMYLRDDWRGDSLRDVSIVLHEMVHHLQAANGVEPRPCAAEAWEKPAYEAQFAFIEAAGQDPLKVMGMNDMALLTATTCSGH